MAKSKRPFLSGYKTYDPTVEGYGSPRQWKAAFASTMNLDEARAAVGEETPEGILGVTPAALWSEVVSAFKRLLRLTHPDRCVVNQMTVEQATENSKRLIGAYTLLKERYGQ